MSTLNSEVRQRKSIHNDKGTIHLADQTVTNIHEDRSAHVYKDTHAIYTQRYKDVYEYIHLKRYILHNTFILNYVLLSSTLKTEVSFRQKILKGCAGSRLHSRPYQPLDSMAIALGTQVHVGSSSAGIGCFATEHISVNLRRLKPHQISFLTTVIWN